MIVNPEIVKTGNNTVDGILTVLLSTTILVGGFIGCLLDNIIPGKNKFFIFILMIAIKLKQIQNFANFFQGTNEERGLVAWSNQMSLNIDTSESSDDTEPQHNTFDFPVGMKLLRRYKL